MRGLQRGLVGQLLPHGTAALPQRDGHQQQHRHRQARGDGRIARAHPKRRQVVEHHQLPRRATQLARGSELVHAVERDDLHVVRQRFLLHPLQRLQHGFAIRPRALHFGALQAVQRQHRAELDVLAGGEDYHAALVDQHHVARELAPGTLGLLEVDLDGHHAARGLPAAQRVREVVAGLAAGDADTVEGAPALPQCIDHVGAERQVLPDGGAGPVPVRRRERGACGIERVEHLCARRGVDPVEVAVDRVAQRPVRRRAEQRRDDGRHLQQRGQVFEAGQVRVEPSGEHVQPVVARVAQPGKSVLHGDVVAGEGGHGHQCQRAAPARQAAPAFGGVRRQVEAQCRLP
ncbi:hypothetical protein D3C85_921050 [compost metagenome]